MVDGLLQFYKQHNRKMALRDKCQKVLRDHEGREAELYKKIGMRYASHALGVWTFLSFVRSPPNHSWFLHFSFCLAFGSCGTMFLPKLKSTGSSLARLPQSWCGLACRDGRYRDAPAVLLLAPGAASETSKKDGPVSWNRDRLKKFVRAIAPEYAEKFNITGSQMMMLDNKAVQRRCGT
jgi:hypothetical protein